MRSLRLVAAVILPLGIASVLCAQEAPSPGGPPPASKAAAQPVDIGDVQTLKVNVNLVNVYFSVSDKNGYITNLHKDDCSIYEDKGLQKTKNFTQEKNLPLTIGILLDTSGSQIHVLPLEQQSGADMSSANAFAASTGVILPSRSIACRTSRCRFFADAQLSRGL